MTSHLGVDGASNRVILKVRLTWWYGRKRLDQMMILTGDSSSIFTKFLDFLSLIHKLFQTQTNWESVCLFVFLKELSLRLTNQNAALCINSQFWAWKSNQILCLLYDSQFFKNLEKMTFEENQDFSQKRKCLADFPLCWVFQMSQTAEESK